LALAAVVVTSNAQEAPIVRCADLDARWSELNDRLDRCLAVAPESCHDGELLDLGAALTRLGVGSYSPHLPNLVTTATATANRRLWTAYLRDRKDRLVWDEGCRCFVERGHDGANSERSSERLEIREVKADLSLADSGVRLIRMALVNRTQDALTIPARVVNLAVPPGGMRIKAELLDFDFRGPITNKHVFHDRRGERASCYLEPLELRVHRLEPSDWVVLNIRVKEPIAAGEYRFELAIEYVRDAPLGGEMAFIEQDATRLLRMTASKTLTIRDGDFPPTAREDQGK
jgi:hypothetical protein